MSGKWFFFWETNKKRACEHYHRHTESLCSGRSRPALVHIMLISFPEDFLGFPLVVSKFTSWGSLEAFHKFCVQSKFNSKWNAAYTTICYGHLGYCLIWYPNSERRSHITDICCVSYPIKIWGRILFKN